jgi:hypothetical protein
MNKVQKLTVAGTIGLVAVVGGVFGGLTAMDGGPAPKVAVVQRSDATTPTTTTTAPAPTATTLPAGTDPVTAANSAAGSASQAAQSATQAASSAATAEGAANQAKTPTTAVQSPPPATTPTTQPVVYCAGSEALDDAAPEWLDVGTVTPTATCSDPYDGSFLYNTDTADAPVGWYRV